MTTPYVIDLLGLPELQRGGRGHWSKRYQHDKRWRTDVAWSVKAWQLEQPFDLAVIFCTRFSTLEPDHDNLVASFKACIDGLVEGRALINDKTERVQMAYRWEHAKKHEGRIRIVVTPVTRLPRERAAELGPAARESVMEGAGDGW